MKITDTQQRPAAGPLEYLAGGFLGLLTLLLPIKFASLAVMPEATSFFPGYWSAYLFDVTWPAHSFGMASGVALLLALIAFGLKAPAAKRSAMGRTALLLAFAVPFAGLPGLIHCETPDYGIWECSHLIAIGAYIWAVYLTLARRPEWRNLYIGISVAAAFFVVYSGFRQYFVGFDEMREFARQQYKDGIQLGRIMSAKLDDDRVFATFASCNVLGGYLILMLPIVGYALWRAGDRFEPEKISRPLLSGLGIAFLAVVLFLTRGRGALLAAVLAAIGFAFTLPMRKLYRTGLLLLALLIIAGGALFVHYRGRGFGTMEERADYLRTSIIMLSENPLIGQGWGGFFYRHMKLKTTATDEAAHTPHNLIASFATQAGIPAGVLVTFALLYPLAALGRRIYRNEADGTTQAIFWGETAFLLHTLMDVDLQIPGSMALSGGLMLAAFATPPKPAPTIHCPPRVPQLVAALLLAGAAFGGSFYIVRCEIAYDKLLRLIQPQSADDLTLRPTPDNVARTLQEAVALRPYSPFPWESAGDFYLAVKNYGDAEYCLKEALTRTTGRPSVYEKLSRIESARGNEKRAAALFREAHNRFPANPQYDREEEPGNLSP